MEFSWGQFGHKKMSQYKMHKSHIIFHINSWMSYFQFLGSEKAIMSEWADQNTTFPTKQPTWIFRMKNYFLTRENIKSRVDSTFYLLLEFSIWFDCGTNSLVECIHEWAYFIALWIWDASFVSYK